MTESIERLAYRKISDYVLVRAIGRGTHYTLYQAVDPGTGRMVVIKILHVAAGKPDTDAELAAVLEARLQREAHALSSLSHPNIPAIYEMGEQDGHPFLVMEYLIGHPLRQHLDLRHLDLKGLPMDEALRILEQVALAVDAIHAQGILHRDIRASNVMLLHDGSVKLVEFGLARQPGDATVTLMGALVGEPAYMAPEQLRNQPAAPQSDLWAMGVLLYEMLAGRPPFEGANFALTAHQVVMGQPAPVPGVSAAVQAVLDRALEKDPEKRYSRAQDMVHALKKAGGASAQPRKAARGQAFGKPTPRSLAYAAGFLALLAASILLGLSLARTGPHLTPTVSAATLSAPALSAPALSAPALPPPVLSIHPPATRAPRPALPAAINKTPFGPGVR